MNRAFLDEQAGILALALDAGMPCPVCGATEHPSPAAKTADAPSESDLEKAKKKSETAQADAASCSAEASTLGGKVTAKEEELKKKGAELFDEVVFAELSMKIAGEVKENKSQIGDLKELLRLEQEKLQQKARLEAQIPKTGDRASKTAGDTGEPGSTVGGFRRCNQGGARRLWPLWRPD